MFTKLLNAISRLSPNSETVKFLTAAKELRWKLNDGAQVVYLAYPINAEPRYGFGKPPHKELYQFLNHHRENYRNVLNKVIPFTNRLATIPFEKPSDSSVPYWDNGFIGGLEAMALYCFPAIYGSRHYIEIGSGNSTKFVRRSISDNRLNTKITSIDPHPRAEIDKICDEVIRKGLEEVDQTIFDQLEPGDILMFDGSHYCFQNSDVTVFFLEILPRIKPGVLVYIDDIYLPYDYPPVWKDRYYAEQYVLATLLLAQPGRYEILLPCVFIAQDENLRHEADAVIQHIRPQGLGGYGNGFWMRVAQA